MKKPSIGIVVPFFNTPMWVQTSIYGLVSTIPKYRDKYDIEVLLIDNVDSIGGRSPKKNFIDAVKLVPELCNEITLVENPEKTKFHGTALDHAVRYFNTDYLLCWESDIAIYKDDWLDWIMAYIKDDNIWMAGYEFTDHYESKDSIAWYVMPNPGIYRMSILKEINKECQDNKDMTFYWGENYFQNKIIDPYYQMGCFSERRGFKNIHLNCPDGKGKLARPNAEYYENGQWMFYKMMRDYPNLFYKVFQQERKLQNYNGELAPTHCCFGDGRFLHYWAGTRSWDFLIHPEQNISQINYVKEKILLEMNIWKERVPERIRKVVPEVFNSSKNVVFEYDNLKWIYNNNVGTVHHRNLSLGVADWYKK